jgi:hypothetical protein
MSLTSFPSMVLSTRRLPSLLQGPGEPGSPALGSTMKALRLPIRVSTVAYWFASAAHVILRLSCSLAALPGVAEASPGPGPLFRRRPQAPAQFTWTRMGSLRSSDDPSCAFAPLHDPGRTDMPSPTSSVMLVLPPLDGRRRLQRLLISGLTRSFSTRCHTLHACRCRIRARLASGWPARPLPRGSRTPWTATRGFSSCSRSSSSPALLTQPSFETLARRKRRARSSG